MTKSLCPCCHQPQHVYVQPSMFAERPSFTLAECHTVGCKLAYVTLAPGDHEQLTPAQIDGYARSNRAFVSTEATHAAP